EGAGKVALHTQELADPHVTGEEPLDPVGAVGFEARAPKAQLETLTVERERAVEVALVVADAREELERRAALRRCRVVESRVTGDERLVVLLDLGADGLELLGVAAALESLAQAGQGEPDQLLGGAALAVGDVALVHDLAQAERGGDRQDT